MNSNAFTDPFYAGTVLREVAGELTVGLLRVSIDGDERLIPLPRSALLGRHEVCHGLLAHSDVPLHWLEVRWLGVQWAWRALHETGGRTRGSGRMLGDGWRNLAGAKVSCGPHVWIRLEDPAPPDWFAVELGARAFVTGESLDDLVEVRDGKLYELDADFNDVQPIRDNEVRVLQGSAYRFHVAGVLPNTDKRNLSIANVDCVLDIDLPNLSATFTVGSRDVVVSGEGVRVLAAYARVRLEDGADDGGWLGRSDIFDVWCELGGQKQSPSERIGWEKGKLRNRLVRAGASGVEQLFENRIHRGQRESRLSLGPARIRIL